MTRPRRFRLDSATGPEALKIGCLAAMVTGGGARAERLLLHWWRLGLRRETALRCPTCAGTGATWDYGDDVNDVDDDCQDCMVRGWSMPHERGTLG